MFHAEQALVRAIQCGTNGAFCFPVSETDRTPIRSVKDAQDYLDKLMLEQRIKQLKEQVAAMEVKAAKAAEEAKAAEATSNLQAVAEKVAHFAMEA
jgi:hypothetical protein